MELAPRRNQPREVSNTSPFIALNALSGDVVQILKLEDESDARNNASTSRKKLSPLLAKRKTAAEQQYNDLAKKRSHSVSNLFRKSNNQTSGNKSTQEQTASSQNHRAVVTPYRAEPPQKHFPMQRSFDLRKRQENQLSSSSIEDLTKKISGSATKLRVAESLENGAFQKAYPVYKA